MRVLRARDRTGMPRAGMEIQTGTESLYIYGEGQRETEEEGRDRERHREERDTGGRERRGRE